MKLSLFTTSLNTRQKIIIGIVTTLLLIGGGVFAYSYVQNQPEVVQDKPQEVVCEPNFECNEWSECVDGEQVRVCTDSNSCEGSESREETRECEIVEPEVVEKEETVEPEPTPEPEEPQEEVSGYVPPTLGPFNIEIRGDEACQNDISTALGILRTRAPEYYNEVRKYVGVIECNPFDGSGISKPYPFESPPRILIAPGRPERSFEWVASIIAHEMIHNRDYLDYLVRNQPSDNRVPQCIGQGLEAEIATFREQIQVMKQINAPEFEINAVQNYLDSGRINGDYSSIPCE